MVCDQVAALNVSTRACQASTMCGHNLNPMAGRGVLQPLLSGVARAHLYPDAGVRGVEGVDDVLARLHGCGAIDTAGGQPQPAAAPFSTGITTCDGREAKRACTCCLFQN